MSRGLVGNSTVKTMHRYHQTIDKRIFPPSQTTTGIPVGVRLGYDITRFKRYDIFTLP